jgi:hypothetical protein
MAAGLMRCTKALTGSLEIMQGIIREQVSQIEMKTRGIMSQLELKINQQLQEPHLCNQALMEEFQSAAG